MGGILIPLYTTVRSNFVEERFELARFSFLTIERKYEISRSTSQEAAQLLRSSFARRFHTTVSKCRRASWSYSTVSSSVRSWNPKGASPRA